MNSKTTNLVLFILVVIHICYCAGDVHHLIDISENINNKTDANAIDNEISTSKSFLNPCLSSPCGPNAECQAKNGNYTCNCLPNFINRPPNCRPECSANSHCANEMVCTNHRCKDPCDEGICGLNAKCRVDNHMPICECLKNHTGDPFILCSPKAIQLNDLSPCNPNPCGEHTICHEQQGVAECTCLPDYYGNPLTGCMPKCVLNGDCTLKFACIQNECRDPCPGVCPENANCLIEDHLPTCACKEGYTGDSYRNCSKIQDEPEKTDACQESPCGPNSQCKDISGIAACSCLPGINGSPPNCTSGCEISSECATDEACVNHKCVNPCSSDVCGVHANCTVINHNPICTCSNGYTGNAFSACHELLLPPFIHPCLSSPCGPNSVCRLDGNSYTCHCMPNFIGNPPNCTAECASSSDCASHLACIDRYCKNPCADQICGENAKCYVQNHTPICACPKNYTGNAFEKCSPKEIAPVNDHECTLNADCPSDKACFKNQCLNPCNETCGLQADCHVVNHTSTCTCPAGYTGEPLVACHLIPLQERNSSVEIIAWQRSETTLFVVWKSEDPTDSIFSEYKVSIEPSDATESVFYVKKETNSSEFAEGSFDGLVPGRAYNVSIQRKSGNKLSKPATASYRTLPARPFNVTIDTNSITSNDFRVTWDTPINDTEFDDYEVMIHSESTTFEYFLQNLSRAGDSIRWFGSRKNLEPGQTYEITVKTVSGGVASWPETLNVTTKPLPVKNLQTSIDNKSGSVTVSWEADETSVQDEYKVSYHEVLSDLLSTTDSVSVNTNQTSYIFESLLPNRNYSVTVLAISKNVESNESTVYVLSPPPTNE